MRARASVGPPRFRLRGRSWSLLVASGAPRRSCPVAGRSRDARGAVAVRSGADREMVASREKRDLAGGFGVTREGSIVRRSANRAKLHGNSVRVESRYSRASRARRRNQAHRGVLNALELRHFESEANSEINDFVQLCWTKLVALLQKCRVTGPRTVPQPTADHQLGMRITRALRIGPPCRRRGRPGVCHPLEPAVASCHGDRGRTLVLGSSDGVTPRTAHFHHPVGCALPAFNDCVVVSPRRRAPEGHAVSMARRGLRLPASMLAVSVAREAGPRSPAIE